MTGFSMRSGGFSHAKYLNPLPPEPGSAAGSHPYIPPRSHPCGIYHPSVTNVYRFRSSIRTLPPPVQEMVSSSANAFSNTSSASVLSPAWKGLSPLPHPDAYHTPGCSFQRKTHMDIRASSAGDSAQHLLGNAASWKEEPLLFHSSPLRYSFLRLPSSLSVPGQTGGYKACYLRNPCKSTRRILWSWCETAHPFRPDRRFSPPALNGHSFQNQEYCP